MVYPITKAKRKAMLLWKLEADIITVQKANKELTIKVKRIKKNVRALKAAPIVDKIIRKYNDPLVTKC